MGRSRLDPNRRDAGNLAVDLRQRSNVRHAPFRWTDGASLIARWLALVLVPSGFRRTAALEHRQFTHHGLVGGHGLGYRRLLHVANDAGCRFRAFPAWRRTADGTYGDRRHVVHLLHFAFDGTHFRYGQDSG